MSSREDLAALARRLDHTLLKPDATADQVLKACELARSHGLASVCVAPSMLACAVEALRGSSVRPASVVGFPHGNTLTTVKVFEAAQLIGCGAEDIDMVINVGRLKAAEYSTIEAEIREVVREVHSRAGAIAKVIIEVAYLTEQEKKIASELVEQAGADFVKTSTGYAPGGATIEDVKLLRACVGRSVGVKAAGGIRTTEFALALIAAGADRIGSSASVQLLDGLSEIRKELRGTPT